MKNPILKVKNFGPIGENRDKKGNLIDDGFFTIEFAPVTVFIGPQASGKSTLLKLYSSFLWIEKALVQGKIWDLPDIGIISLPDIHANHIGGRAVRSSLDKYLNYQNMQSYTRKDFKIKYCGTMYDIEVELLNDQNLLSLHKNDCLEIQFSIHFNYNYFCPKIMYVPSERNLLTINEKNADKLSELSGAIKTFQERYGLALNETSKDIISLPIENLNARYDGEKQTVFIINKNQTETPISEASSGCQSVVPVVVVSKYLTDKTKTFDFKKSVYNSSVFIRKIVKKRSTKDEYDIFDELTKSLDERKFANEIKNIEEKFSYLFNRCFINIVEEPEQNLFPETQAEVLYELLKCKNANEHNKLIFSTHSPYLISYLTQSAKVADLKNKCNNDEQKLKELKDGVKKISPKLFDAAVLGDDIKIYETFDGEVREKENYENLPNDDNALNNGLRKINDEFDKLFELGEF